MPPAPRPASAPHRHPDVRAAHRWIGASSTGVVGVDSGDGGRRWHRFEKFSRAGKKVSRSVTMLTAHSDVKSVEKPLAG